MEDSLKAPSSRDGTMATVHAPAAAAVPRARQSEPSLREWVPPALLRLAGAVLRRHVRFTGNFGSWEDAARGVRGYEDADILETVRRATREVVSGRAAAERDGYLLDSPEPSFPVIAAILREACRDAVTTVIDFGGGLGGTYYQCKPFLEGLGGLEWKVVEQKAFAECGREEFSTSVLRFYGEFDDALAGSKPSVIVFSGVLQYLRSPEAVLAQAVAAAPGYIVIDRTPFLHSERSVLALQLVPAQLGGARYPAWLFSEEQLLGALEPRYRLLHGFDAIDGVLTHGLKRVDFKGFVFERAV